MSTDFDFDESYEECKNHDQDLIRHGAHKITRQLARSHQFTEQQYAKICEQILNMLTAKTSEKQERSKDVKAAGIALLKELAPTRDFSTYSQIMDTLLQKFRQQGRDMPLKKTDGQIKEAVSLMELYALGLKIIIEKCNESSSKEVVDKLSKELLRFIRDRTLRANTKLVELSFETLSKMLKSHGDLLIESQYEIVHLCLNDLHSNSKILRSRCITCLGAVCSTLDDKTLHYLTETLLNQITTSTATGEGKESKENKESKTEKNENQVNVSIEAFSIIASRCGHRLGDSLPIVIPLFLKFIGDVSDESDSMTGERMCTLRENMCIALKKFAESLSVEVSNIDQDGKGMDMVLDKMFELMKFDPIYGGNDDDDDDDGSGYDDSDGSDDDNGSEDEEEEEEEEDDDDEDDVDDHSWRVRRAALRVIRAFIQSRPELLSTMYRRCVGADGGSGSGPLVERLSERHDGVRIEVIMTVRELFHKSTERHRSLLRNTSSKLAEETLKTLKYASASRAHKLLRQRSDHIVLSDRSSAIMKKVSKIFRSISKGKTKSNEIISELFLMLKEWLIALGGQITSFNDWGTTTQSVNQLVPGVIASLQRVSTNVSTSTKGNALEFLIALCDSHGSSALNYEHTSSEYQALMKGVISCTKEEGIKCQALKMLQSMISKSIPQNTQQSEGAMVHDSSFDILVSTCTHLLKDKEGEVKKSAVETCSGLLEYGSIMKSKWLSEVWTCVANTLDHESARTTSMRCISRVLKKGGASQMLKDASVATTMLHKLQKLFNHRSRTIRSSALNCVTEIVTSFDVPLQSRIGLIELSSNAMDQEDPNLGVLHLITKLLSKGNVEDTLRASLRTNWDNNLWAKVVHIICSDRLDGISLNKCCDFLKTITTVKGIDAYLIVKDILSTSITTRSKTTMICIAKCIASLCQSDTKCLTQVIQTFSQTLSVQLDTIQQQEGKSNAQNNTQSSTQSNTRSLQMALYCLGEIGLTTDLNLHVSKSHMQQIFLSFQAKDGALRESSAYCVGNAALSNMAVLLPQILQQAERSATSSATTALMCLRTMMTTINKLASMQSIEIDMSNYVEKMLIIFRQHIFPRSTTFLRQASNGNGCSEHEIELTCECWGLLSTMPGVAYGILSSGWVSYLDTNSNSYAYFNEGKNETTWDRPSEEVKNITLISELTTVLQEKTSLSIHRCNAVVALSHVVKALGSRSLSVIVEDVDDLRTLSEKKGRNLSEAAPGKLREILSLSLETIIELSNVVVPTNPAELDDDVLKTGEASLKLIGALLYHHKSLMNERRLT